MYLFGVLVIETTFLLVFMILDKPSVHYSKVQLMMNLSGFQQATCSTSGTIGSTLLIIFNVMLILYVLKLAWTIRNVPSKFNEGKLLAIISFTIGFVLVMVLPVTAFLTEPRAIYILLSSGILFTSMVVAISMVIPNLVVVLKRIDLAPVSAKPSAKNSPNDTNNHKTGHSAHSICVTCGARCLSCKQTQEIAPNVSLATQSFSD